MREERKIKILFLCIGNSCRSQMAEGWTTHLLSDSLKAYSAGTKPKGVDPKAIKVMLEAGVDISRQRSKHIDELANINFNAVITLCGDAFENCPVFAGTTKVMHFGFDDPPRLAENSADEDEALEHYRKIRDEIKQLVFNLPEVIKKT